MQFHSIVIDGGPCGGKTTVLAFLQQKLADFGYHVIVASEQATELMTSGLGPKTLSSAAFQKMLLQDIIRLEDHRKEMAIFTRQEKVVMLCDRGAMTGAAYTTPAEFERIIGEEGYSKVDLRDKRYDGVVFLRSVAVDKPEVYTLANNIIRTESIEEARALDQKTEEAWTGCEHIWFVDNQTDVRGKALKALQAICRILGIPQPLEIEKKYKISNSFDLSHILHYPSAVTVDIEQYYLENKHPGSERVRARSQQGGVTYYHTIKKDVSPGVRLEHQKQIEEKEYFSLLGRVDWKYAKIEKKRTCFVYKNQYFEFDLFMKPPRLRLLEIEMTSEVSKIELPDFLVDHATDVTGNPEFGNAEIARLACVG